MEFEIRIPEEGYKEAYECDSFQEAVARAKQLVAEYDAIWADVTNVNNGVRHTIERSEIKQQ